MAEWINVKDIADGAKFYAGAAIRIMPKCRRRRQRDLPPLARDGNCVLGSEIKRMFESELQEAFVSKRIKIAVN